MTPSGKIEAAGDKGEMGEWRTHEFAAAMVGLPGGVVSEVLGASAFFGGSVKSCMPRSAHDAASYFAQRAYLPSPQLVS